MKNVGGKVEFEVSAVQEAALRVFERVLEVSAEADTVVCMLLVEASEASSVIGKCGRTVAKLRRESGAKIRVLLGDSLPAGVSTPLEVVEIEGDVMAVKRALLGVSAQLQECSQAEKLSIKQNRPLESISQSAGHDFRADLPPHQTPLSLTTSSYTSAVVGRSSSSEADVLSTSKSNLQQEVVFRILCSNDRVGGLIGRGGSIVQGLEEESGASIHIGSTVANCNERMVTISSMEDADSRYSPAQRAVFLVYSRCIEAGAERGLEAGLNKGSSVAARLAVPTNQVGCLLGIGGAIISEIRKATRASIHIYNGDQVPKCAEQDDEVVEISGQFVNTQDALYHVTSRLRHNIFNSKAMNIPGSGTGKIIFNTSVHGRVRDVSPIDLRQSSGTSQNIDGLATLRQGLDPLLHPHVSNHSPSIGLQTSETAEVDPWNFVTLGRDLVSANGGVEHGGTQRPAIVTNTTVEILLPESSVSSLYGENGSNLSRIKQISGADVIVHEALPGIRNRIVVISGTPNETQAAQSLIHAFILTGSS